METECPGCGYIINLGEKKGFRQTTRRRGVEKHFGALSKYYVTEPCKKCGMTPFEIRKGLIKEEIFEKNEIDIRTRANKTELAVPTQAEDNKQ